MDIRMMRYMKLPLLSVGIAIVVLTIVPTAAFAHFIWATVEKGQVRFALLENVNEAPQAQFAKYVADLAVHCGDKTLSPGESRDGARTATLPAGQDVVTAESVVGTKERDGKSFLLIYDAKGAVSLTAASAMKKEPAEILASRVGKELIVTVRRAGLAVPETEVWVQWPGGDESSSAKNVKTDSQGEVHIPWPTTVSKNGFVGIRAMVTEETAGELAGKSYASIHRLATLAFPWEGAKTDGFKNAAVTTEAKPLSRILRDAFGANHELAGKAVFNQTVFAGKLTRVQLEIHLQQRALIHSELHRILNAAAHKGSIPYGAAQKHVLVLLFDDLITMGSDWPTEPQALPLTRDFLQEIRDSEPQGPYFALGVWHVYYGGITNGGRMIGEKIGETLHFLPTYYEKSDGYGEYLKEVNKITDPAAQQEMIRGGKAAYKYILAISNEALFQASQ